MKHYDIAILTESRYENPTSIDAYNENVLLEDRLLQEALEEKNLSVIRLDWARENFDWSSVNYAIFRSTWDYFHRFDEFKQWLEKVKDHVCLINSYEQILWNMDKHYLHDLEKKKINIPPSVFVEAGQKITLAELHEAYDWSHSVLKPAISGAGRHTYQLHREHLKDYEEVFQELIAKESMMLQPFLKNIPLKGEMSLMMMNGKYTHTVLKQAKSGDFRVQDDFGGTVATYEPTESEVIFAEKIIMACDPLPMYARVDIVWDNDDQLALSELELIEPELWFRLNPNAAKVLAEGVVNLANNNLGIITRGD